MQLNRAIVFDRDGVLNSLCGPSLERGPRTMDELVINELMSAPLKLASKHGFQIFVASNQPDVARNLVSRGTHNKITDLINAAFPEIKKFYYCLHDNRENCLCRKPNPGLLNLAVSENCIDPKLSYFVGDKWTDVLAGRDAGFKTILLENSSSWAKTSQGEPPNNLRPDFVITQPSELLPILLN